MLVRGRPSGSCPPVTMTSSRPSAGANLVDVESVLDSTLSLAAGELQSRTCRTVKRYAHVPPVLGEESRLHHVFLNVLVSALQALKPKPEPEGEIAVTTRTSGDRVVVEVATTGEHLVSAEEGELASSLGLSICRNIVSAHGGELFVESTGATGTLLRVILPAAPSRERVKNDPAPTAAATVKRARILVIDDEPLLGQTLGFAFSGRHDVVVISSGREALSLLGQDTHFDLVLCDLMMPDVTGQKVFQTVEREHPELVKNFVFMTGGAFTESAQNFLENHPGRRIEKPFTIREIESLLG